jgi:DNA-binding response OmpR family regulator
MAILCKYKVLIVDDEAMTRDLVSSILSSKGHKCVTASDGVEALDKASKENFDAVITDIVMPNMDGIALTMELLKRNPSTPVMVITGFTDEHYYEESIEAGATDFINKPFSIAEFLARFHRMMRDHETIREIKKREKEIEKIGAEMIAGIQHDASKRIDILKKEIEELKKGLKSA